MSVKVVWGAGLLGGTHFIFWLLASPLPLSESILVNRFPQKTFLSFDYTKMAEREEAINDGNGEQPFPLSQTWALLNKQQI